jgi:hypothetical protein
VPLGEVENDIGEIEDHRESFTSLDIGVKNDVSLFLLSLRSQLCSLQRTSQI